MADPRYRGVDQLLGAYFHPDWDLDHPTEDGVLRQFVDENQDLANRLPSEVDDLLATFPDDTALYAKLVLLGGIYLPRGDDGTYGSWLRSVKLRIERLEVKGGPVDT